MTTTNVAKKITKADRFAKLLSFPDVANDPESVEFIQHELELLKKKNSAERKPTKAQLASKENDAKLRETMLNEMEPGVKYSADDLIKTPPG